MSLNHIIIQGRLVRDPELRHTQSGTAVTSFTIAVDRDYQKGQTDFINVVAWSGTAEFVKNYFAKGRMILVSGNLQMRDWTDKNGANRTTAEVIAEHVYFCDSRKGDKLDGLSKFDSVEFTSVEDNGDLPF